MDQLFKFFSKKFKREVNSISDIDDILESYKDLNIAVRHADSFLKDEDQNKHDEIIKLLEKYWTVKQTGKLKK